VPFTSGLIGVFQSQRVRPRKTNGEKRKLFCPYKSYSLGRNWESAQCLAQ